jgi:multicomponent Na+:H+ antiporter subunit F
MMTNLPPLLQYACYISFSLLIGGVILTFLRLVKGPSMPDRVLSIDLFAIFFMGIVIIYTLYTGQIIYLNAVFVMAFLAFLGTVAFARYLEKRASE